MLLLMELLAPQEVLEGPDRLRAHRPTITSWFTGVVSNADTNKALVETESNLSSTHTVHTHVHTVVQPPWRTEPCVDRTIIGNRVNLQDEAGWAKAGQYSDAITRMTSFRETVNYKQNHLIFKKCDLVSSWLFFISTSLEHFTFIFTGNTHSDAGCAVVQTGGKWPEVIMPRCHDDKGWCHWSMFLFSPFLLLSDRVKWTVTPPGGRMLEALVWVTTHLGYCRMYVEWFHFRFIIFF